MIRCEWCGQFINHGYVYTPFGTYLDEEPPDDKHICDKCFTPERKALLSNQWRQPLRFDWREYEDHTDWMGRETN